MVPTEISGMTGLYSGGKGRTDGEISEFFDFGASSSISNVRKHCTECEISAVSMVKSLTSSISSFRK